MHKEPCPQSSEQDYTDRLHPLKVFRPKKDPPLNGLLDSILRSAGVLHAGGREGAFASFRPGPFSGHSMHQETVVSVSRMRALDRYAIAAGVPGRLLMEVAGHGAFQLLSRVRTGHRTVSILTGSGNNAGDGFVVARYCASSGIQCRVLAVAPVEAFPDGDARANASLLETFSVPVETCDPETLARHVGDSDIVVDGLLGTGLSGDVRAPYDAVISALNKSGRQVLALDVPSGLCGDTGRVLGVAVRARWTVTFGARKQGLLVGDGPAHAGEVTVVPLPFPPDSWNEVP